MLKHQMLKAPRQASRHARPKHKVTGGLIAPAPRMPKIKALRQLLGLSQEELARILGCSTRSVAGWEAADDVGQANQKRVVEIDRLGKALAQLLPPDDHGQWLRTHNPAFENRTPIEVIAAGESDRLWRMVHQINAGVAA